MRDVRAHAPGSRSRRPPPPPPQQQRAMPPAAEERPRDEEDTTWIDADLLQHAVAAGDTIQRIDVQRAVAKGDNYLSVLFRVRVEYRPADSQETRERHLVVKDLPPGEFIQTFIQETGVFGRELIVYADALPRFYALADARLGEGSFRKLSADFVKSARPDTLILEDLKPQGFVMANRKDRLDLAHSKLVVDSMARLHALSAAYEEKNPGFISQFDDVMYSERNRKQLSSFIPVQVRGMAEEICRWEGFQKIGNKLGALADKSVDKLIEICEAPAGIAVFLIHGDSWVNNFLFKYSETGVPTDLRFVDFQLSRGASPAFDLTYFLYSSPRTDVRKCYYEYLLEYYCESFQSWAKKLGYHGPTITLQELKREMDRILYFGFISALTTMAVVLADPEDTPDLSELTNKHAEEGATNIFEKVYKSSKFREAFQNLLPYFEEHGIFD